MIRRIFLIYVFLLSLAGGCNNSESVSSPLFIDPNYHGSCDPEIIFNEHDEYYYIYYTARRSLLEENFVRTPIGVIRSKDLTDWEFLGYCKFDGVGGEKDADATFWAPAIVNHEGRLHMFVTWKPDTTTRKGPWGGPSKIVHYSTSADDPMDGWEKESDLHEDEINALDATAYIKEGKCYVWYKGKAKGSRKNELFHVVTDDFNNWQAKGFSKSDVFNKAATGSGFEEAPYLFSWKERYWLITDPHDGLFVYSSDDAEDWNFRKTILEEGGDRQLDNSMARHPSVIVVGERAFIVYHVEPWRRYDLEKLKGENRLPIYKQPTKNRRSVLQIAELELVDGEIVCDRNKSIIVD